MKNLVIIITFLLSSTFIQAQKSIVKAGAYFNADIADHKLGKINYPSLEASYELAFGNKFSLNLSYNYAKREYESGYTGEGFQVFYYNPKYFINYDQSIIIEGRYYIKSNSTGFFVQAGIPFTYTIEKSYNKIPLPGESDHKVYSYAISTFGGIGVKCPFSDRFGVEINIAVHPSYNFLDVDYGTSGFIKSGVKLFFALDKVKK
jgi:hypothetical protein